MDSSVQDQIIQMTKFIENEAMEKIREIQVLGAENAEMMRAKILAEKKKIIDSNFDQKLAEIETQKKIEISNLQSENSLKVLDTQTSYIFDKLKDNVTNTIREHIRSPASKAIDTGKYEYQSSYEEMSTKLILEGVYAVYEPVLLLQCLKEDVPLMKRAAAFAVQMYEDEAAQFNADKRIRNLAIHVLEESNFSTYSKHFNQPYFSNEYAYGGARISNTQNSISVDNTLDKRIEMTFTKLLPQIKTLLYGPSETRTYMH